MLSRKNSNLPKEQNRNTRNFSKQLFPAEMNSSLPTVLSSIPAEKKMSAVLNPKLTSSSKSKGKSTSTKIHDAPMGKRDMYFALDCEMVGVGPEGLESALARVSIVNWDYEIVLDTYVKVDQPVSDYRTFVSGIKEENLQSESAMSVEDVRSITSNILRGKILIGHGLENDLKVLGLSHPITDIRDTATYEPFMRRVPSISTVQTNEMTFLKPRKLKDLVLEKLGKEIQVLGLPHSPVEDAISCMDLYKSVRLSWEQAMIEAIHNSEQENVDNLISPWSVQMGLYGSPMHFPTSSNSVYSLPQCIDHAAFHRAGNHDACLQVIPYPANYFVNISPSSPLSNGRNSVLYNGLPPNYSRSS